MSTLTTVSLEEVGEHFGSSSSLVDTGSVPTSRGIAHLGQLEVLGLGAPSNQDGRLGEMSQLLAAVAERSMACAFSLWAHPMVIEYHLLADPDRDRTDVVDRLLAGELPGATAMASALQHELGVGQLGVTFEWHGDELRLDGKVRWASNLFPDGFLVVLAAQDTTGNRVVVAVPSDSPGLSVDPYPELLALGATASSSLTLRGVTVPAEHVLTYDVPRFLQQMRGPFLLLQSSFCVGLIGASLQQVAGRLVGVNETFAERYEELEQRRAQLQTDLAAACDRRSWHEIRRDVLALRLEAAVLAQDAVALEAKVQGGAGYLRASDTARRLREAAFLPVQSPTEALLRWELSCSNS